MQKGVNFLLCCDGLQSGGAKRKLPRDEEASTAKRSQVDIQEYVQEIVDELKKQHSDKYTAIHYRRLHNVVVVKLHHQ